MAKRDLSPQGLHYRLYSETARNLFVISAHNAWSNVHLLGGCKLCLLLCCLNKRRTPSQGLGEKLRPSPISIFSVVSRRGLQITKKRGRDNFAGCSRCKVRWSTTILVAVAGGGEVCWFVTCDLKQARRLTQPLSWVSEIFLPGAFSCPFPPRLCRSVAAAPLSPTVVLVLLLPGSPRPRLLPLQLAVTFIRREAVPVRSGGGSSRTVPAWECPGATAAQKRWERPQLPAARLPPPTQGRFPPAPTRGLRGAPRLCLRGTPRRAPRRTGVGLRPDSEEREGKKEVVSCRLL